MYLSRIVKVGNVEIGGRSPVKIQSMTNTHTGETRKTIDQIKELYHAGCDLVRVTTQNIPEAENLSNIISGLQKEGVVVPIIADVHFNPKVALVAARYAHKVRINPGNYYSSDRNISNIEAISKNLKPLLDVCEEYNTVLRIGVNHGSLSNRILEKYGDTPLGMVESLMEFVEVCNRYNFHNIILSVKTSNVDVMIEANELLVDRLIKENLDYPIHLGVTEAGGDIEGRIKSAAGIGYLLTKGIGDTIRVSLSEHPVEEVPVAKHLVFNYSRHKVQLLKRPQELTVRIPENVKHDVIIVSEKPSKYSDLAIDHLTESEKQGKLFVFEYDSLNFDDLLIRATIDIIKWSRENIIKAIMLKSKILNDDENLLLLRSILQAIGIRVFSTEYIACPSCGRTNLDIVSLLKEVKVKTSHLKGLKIAVMGCVVNGPGEMRNADYGIVGRGNGTVNLYKSGVIFDRRIQQDDAVEALIGLIKESGDWQ